MTRMLVTAFTALALTGCAGVAADTCRSFGYTPGTDQFLNCAQSEMNALRAEYRHVMDTAMNRLNDAYGTSQSEPSDQAAAEQ